MNSNNCVEFVIDNFASEIDKILEANTIGIIGPMFGDLESKLKVAVETIPEADKKKKAAIVLETDGGVVEIVERMVTILRYHYAELHFIIPDHAMSAGTIFAMSGDHIWMDYYACLGPIDPQIERDGRLVPALSYVKQFEKLVEKSVDGDISPAELVLLQKLDLADLHRYEQAKELSVSLLEEWLSKYKFKDWHKTETHGKVVTEEMKRTRAREIAEALSDNTRWKTHGRPISMSMLTHHLNLKVNDLAGKPALRQTVDLYRNILVDYSIKVPRLHLVHRRGMCQ